MADFWGGVAKGFGPAYESALERREREAKEEKAEKARTAAAALAARIRNEALALAQEKYDTEQEQQREARELAGRKYQAQQTRLDQADEDARQVVARAKEGRMRGLQAKIAATDIASQQEASKIRGGFQMGGLEPGVEARTLTPTPEQSQALSEDELGVIEGRATAWQKIKDEAEKRRLDEARTGREKMMETYQAPAKATATSKHEMEAQLVAKINDPNTTPKERELARKVLDQIAPAGGSKTDLQRKEDYVRTLADPNASLGEKKIANDMLELLGGSTTEVYGEGGQLLFRMGKARTGAQKPAAPSDIDSALLDLKRIKGSFNPDNPQVGWFATVKSLVGDKWATQLGFEGWADAQRAQFRQDVEEFSNKYVKALNQPDPRLSDMDRRMLKPLAPNVNDSPFMFAQKINTIDRKFKLHSKFNAAHGGEKDVWSMSVRDILDGRKINPVTKKSRINDELAAFALEESHGLRGRTKEQLVEEAGNLWKEKKITKDELAFWLESVFGR